MGKQSRRTSRRNRPGRVRVRASSDGLTVSVVTSPEVTGSGQVSLIPDLRLVRSALLYADRVELISPGLAMLGTFDSLKDAGKVDPVKLVATLDDATLARLGLEGTAQEVRSSFTRLARVLALPERLRRRKMSLGDWCEWRRFTGRSGQRWRLSGL